MCLSSVPVPNLERYPGKFGTAQTHPWQHKPPRENWASASLQRTRGCESRKPSHQMDQELLLPSKVTTARDVRTNPAAPAILRLRPAHTWAGAWGQRPCERHRGWCYLQHFPSSSVQLRVPAGHGPGTRVTREQTSSWAHRAGRELVVFLT